MDIASAHAPALALICVKPSLMGTCSNTNTLLPSCSANSLPSTYSATLGRLEYTFTVVSSPVRWA